MDAARRRLQAVRKKLIPPAVVPLIDAYTDESRGWNSSRRRISAQNQLSQGASDANSIDSLREWILNQRYSGILVETWFAFRCFDPASEEFLPGDDFEAARIVIESYVRGYQRLSLAARRSD